LPQSQSAMGAAKHECEVDAVEAKRLRKAAKRAAAEAAAAEVEPEEVDAAVAKKQRKEAKRAAAEAAAAAEEEDAAPPKKKKKSKATAEEEAAPEATEEEAAAEAKRQRKAAKAAKRAAAEAEAGADAEEEKAPPKKKQKEEAEAEAVGKSEKSVSDPNPHRLFVGGIAWSVDEETLKKDFTECGEIVDIKLLMDKETGASRGIAFITFKDEAGFKAALKFDGEEYAGRKLNCSKANSDGGKGKGKGDEKGKGKGKGKGKAKGPGPKPDGCTSVVVKGLAYAVTSEDLEQVFSKCGNGPSNVKLLTDRETGKSRGIAFVDFDDEKAIDAAMKLTETELKGRNFFMDYSQPREQW